MSVDLVVSNSTPTPIYRQIYEQLRAQIMKGELASGLCLPPIRTVAAQLRISVITVKKAWEELEREGLIVTRVGKGCFVAELGAPQRDDRRYELAAAKLREALDYCATLGLTKQEALALLEGECKE